MELLLIILFGYIAQITLGSAIYFKTKSAPHLAASLIPFSFIYYLILLRDSYSVGADGRYKFNDLSFREILKLSFFKKEHSKNIELNNTAMITAFFFTLTGLFLYKTDLMLGTILIAISLWIATEIHHLLEEKENYVFLNIYDIFIIISYFSVLLYIYPLALGVLMSFLVLGFFGYFTAHTAAPLMLSFGIGILSYLLITLIQFLC